MHRLGRFAAPFDELVASVAQGIWCFVLTHNADHCPALAEFVAQVGEIGVAGDQTKDICPVLEHRLLCIQGERDV